VLHLLVESKTYLQYPPVGQKQSHFCYFDAESQKMYVVKKESKKSYAIYHYNATTGQLLPVGQTTEEPLGFVGEKVHLVRRVKLPGERSFWGHYLVPLDPTPATGDFKLLKLVEIDQ
jgi:hypothetical protein